MNETTINGEVIQLLDPDEAIERYMVPSEMRLFAKEGYHIAVLRTDNFPNILTRLFSHFVKQEHPWVADLAVLNPDFEEGDTIEIEAREINQAGFYVHPDPFATIDQKDNSMRRIEDIELYRCTDCGEISTKLGWLHGHIEKHRPLSRFWQSGSTEFLTERTEVLKVTEYEIYGSKEGERL